MWFWCYLNTNKHKHYIDLSTCFVFIKMIHLNRKRTPTNRVPTDFCLWHLSPHFRRDCSLTFKWSTGCFILHSPNQTNAPGILATDITAFDMKWNFFLHNVTYCKMENMQMENDVGWGFYAPELIKLWFAYDCGGLLKHHIKL